MKVLVTGGAGFIGSTVVDQLVASGVDVLVVDNLSPAAHGAAPDYVNPQAELREVDITDANAMARAVAGVDAVCHQAARVGLGVDFGDAVDYVTDNDLGTATLLRALWRSGFGGRLVVASSMVVYGEGAYRCASHGSVRPPARRPDDLDAGRFEPRCPTCGAALTSISISEDAILDPRNVYAATKLHTEHLAQAFGRESGSPVAALRYHNVYGPRMPRETPYAGVASIFRSALENGDAPQITEDGNQRRDFIHVSDIARANVAAILEHPDVTGAFNIATGRPHTIADMADVLWRAHGAHPRQAPTVSGRWRHGDVRHLVASPTRAAELLGFEAEVAFDDGIEEFATAPLRAPLGRP